MAWNRPLLRREIWVMITNRLFVPQKPPVVTTQRTSTSFVTLAKFKTYLEQLGLTNLAVLAKTYLNCQILLKRIDILF